MKYIFIIIITYNILQACNLEPKLNNELKIQNISKAKIIIRESNNDSLSNKYVFDYFQALFSTPVSDIYYINPNTTGTYTIIGEWKDRFTMTTDSIIRFYFFNYDSVIYTDLKLDSNLIKRTLIKKMKFKLSDFERMNWVITFAGEK